MPTFGALLLVNLDVFDSLSMLTKTIIVGGTFLFTGIMPAFPILLMIKSGEVNDLFISRREERTVPYLFAFLSYVVYTFFLYKVIHFPMFIVAMGIGVSISILLITLINLKWKISAHLSGIGGLVGGIFGISYRMGYNQHWWLYLASNLKRILQDKLWQVFCLVLSQFLFPAFCCKKDKMFLDN